MNITLKDTLSRDIKDLPNEIWEDVPGFEGRYQVSQFSRVKSTIFQREIIIKKTLSSGKFGVNLTSSRRNIKRFDCGRLTATVFLRKPIGNEVIRYKDRNCLFDAVYNVEWTSRKESIKTAFNEGKFPKNHGKGTRNGMSKLSPNQIAEIRDQRKQGCTSLLLASKYKVSWRSIMYVSKGINR